MVNQYALCTHQYPKIEPHFYYRKKREEYIIAIFISAFMKLVAFLLILTAFGLRFGIEKEKDTSSKLFYASFAIEFASLLLNCFTIKNFEKLCGFFQDSKRRFLLFITHFGMGVALIYAFETSEEISLATQRGLAGMYCLCSVYTAFRSVRELVQPTWFDRFGWFEVVFINILKLLAVSTYT